MGFKCGIVGLPNVGKSTLFNALTASKNAEAANFPFCTIDPNIGVVDVVDLRLDKLSDLSKSEKKIYTNITFVDIAGLVKGASKGEGLAALPEYLVFNSTNVIKVLPKSEGPITEAHFVYPQSLKNTARVQAFRNFLFSKIGDWK